MKKSKREIKNRILSFTKKRREQKTEHPTQVTKDLFTDIWKNHVDEVRTMAGKLQSETIRCLPTPTNKLQLEKAKKPVHLRLLKDSE